MFSPLKESHEFNKYVKILRVKMTKKSPEDQQEFGRPTRVRKSNKTTKSKNKKHEDQRKPARVRTSSRVKEDCQVPRTQTSKSLEDWHHLRVKTQRGDSTISPPTRGGDREKEEEEDTPESAPDSY